MSSTGIGAARACVPCGGDGTCRIPDDHRGVYETDPDEKRTSPSWFESGFCFSEPTEVDGGCTKSRSASRSAPDLAHCGIDAF